MNFVFNPKKLKKSTIMLLTALIGGSLAAQTDWIKDHALKLANTHPHLASLAGFAVTVLTLLHSPLGSNLVKNFMAEQEETDPDGTKRKAKLVEETSEPTPPSV